MSKEYIKLKIENCQRLVDNASSQEQKEIYQGYLDYWKTFDKNKKPRTKKPVKPRTDFDQEAEEFEIDNAPKQAYYKKDGQWIKTKAFKEYLKLKTQ